MKYDLLRDYKAYLSKVKNLSSETARTYTIRLDNLLDNQNPLKLEKNFDISKAIQNLSTIKHKNHFSQSKNALYYFCEFANIHLSNEEKARIKDLEEKAKKKYRKLNTVSFKEIKKKINYLKDEKLKLSYQTMLATGLRVSELAQITPGDCINTEDSIFFSFIGKGGKEESVNIVKYDYPDLYNKLLAQINSTSVHNKVFYSAVYLQKKAKELGFQCLDLRRAFAKLEYKNSKSKKIVQKKLRHSSIKNTNIYLRSKIKF